MMTLEFMEMMEDMKQAQQRPQQPLPVPRKIKGTLTIKADDDMEFRAQRSTGVSSQQQIAKCGDSKIYDTVGERKPKRICHIVIDKESTDPVAEIYDQVEQLTKGMNPTRAVGKRPKGARLLMNDGDVAVDISRKEHTIGITLKIDVSQTPNYNNQLMNLMQRVSQCFAINQTSLNQLRK
jgi:hypothetical protein